jgi:hypothetical protein
MPVDSRSVSAHRTDPDRWSMSASTIVLVRSGDAAIRLPTGSVSVANPVSARKS